MGTSCDEGTVILTQWIKSFLRGKDLVVGLGIVRFRVRAKYSDVMVTDLGVFYIGSP